MSEIDPSPRDPLQEARDPLEEAIGAFQAMAVCERPADAEVLAQFGVCQGERPQPSRIPTASKRRRLVQIIAAAAAVAALVFGGVAIALRYGWPPESDQVNAPTSPDRPGDVAVQTPSTSEKPESLAVPSRKEQVKESQVIVVATGLDWAPAPPEVPGDSPEVYIRWKVKRALKGEMEKKEFTTRTSTPVADWIDKDWIVFLTPDFMAGKHRLAAYLHIDFEMLVMRLLADEKKADDEK
jgi:hypothetical protein